MSETAILAAENVSKRYDVGGRQVWALREASMSLWPGKATVILGPSGAGKSTLLHVLAGLEPPTEGSVKLLGKELYKMSDSALSRLRNQSFGFIFQSFNLLPSLTASENVQVPLRLANSREAKKRADAALDLLGLGDRIRHRPGELSGGEQQRVAIARAIVNEPKVIFADEPTGDLDSKTGTEVLQLLVGLVRDKGIACCMVTHNHDWCQYADAIVEIKDGRAEQRGS